MYGGTKEEMLRLVQDAAKIDKSINKNDMSFGNIVKSINVVQKQMGILGTTSKEASTTITGSLNSMKASWKNLLTGVADPSQDFDKLVREFVDSVVVFGKNLAPRIKIVLKGAIDLFKTLGPEIVKAIKEVLPMALGSFGELLGGILGFVTSNIKPIIATIYTLTTAFMTLKAISVIATVVSGVSTAIGALGATATITSQVMAGLNVVMAANPFGAVAAAIALVVGGLALLVTASKSSQSESQKMIAQSEANIEKLQEERQAYEDLCKAKDEEAQASLSQIAYSQSLYNELTRLADANGYVEEKNRSRVDFILGELNEAYGTEWSMVDGVIQKYGELGTSIDDIIAKKQAQIFLDANEGIYTEAIIQKADAVGLQKKAYSDLLTVVGNANKEFEGLNLTVDDVINGLNTSSEINKLWMATNDKTGRSIMTLREQYKTAGDTVAETSNDISNYEAAMAASIEGKHAKVKEILSSGNNAFENAADTVGKTTAQIKQQMGQNYADAVADVAVYLDNYKKNQNSANQQMLDNAITTAAGLRSNYVAVGGAIIDGQVEGLDGNLYKVDETIESGIAAVAEYKTEFQSKGEDAGQGYADGIASKVQAVREAAAGLATEGIGIIAFTQRSASPAKETIKLGNYFGDGYALGILDKTFEVTKSAKTLTEAALDEISDSSMSIDDMIKFESPDYSKLLPAERKYVDDTIAYNQKERTRANEVEERENKQKYKESLDKAKEEYDKSYAEAKKQADKKVALEKYETDKKEALKQYEADEFIRIQGLAYAEEQRMRDRRDYELKKSVDAERKLYEALAKDLKNIAAKEDTLADKLKARGKLYETVTVRLENDETLSYVSLGDLKAQTKANEDFTSDILKLQDRGGVPQQLMDEILGLSLDEGSAFTKALLKADDTTFNDYVSAWIGRHAGAEAGAEAVYADETAAIVAQIPEDFKNIDGDLADVGKDNASAWADGFMSKLKETLPSVIEQINGFFSSAFNGASGSLAIAGGGAGATYSNTYVIQPSPGESTRDQLDAIENKSTLDEMRGGY